MEAIIGGIPAIAGLIEKGGVIGLLLIIIGVLGNEVFRLRKELTKQYGLRDKFRLGFAICKGECDRAGLKPDLSMVNDIATEIA